MTDFTSLNKQDDDFEDESQELISKWSEEYGKQFLESDAASALPTLAREQAIDHIAMFSDFCYSYELEKPGQWTEETVEMVCADLMPRKVMADEQYFKPLTSNLIAFINWLADQGKLHDVAPLVRGLKRADKALMKQVNDPNAWGMAKSLLMGAQDKGYDISNERAIHEALTREAADDLLDSAKQNEKPSSELP